MNKAHLKDDLPKDGPLRIFNDMNVDDVRAVDSSQWIVVLPLGACEQHGPHLPLETDTLIATGIVARLGELLSKNLPKRLKVSFLPVEPVGYSPEHLDYPGSRSLGYDEAVGRWIAIGAYLSSLGIRKMVMLNAHGGNSPLMSIVATELRVRFDMLCVATSWTRFGRPDGLIGAQDAAIDIHGGEIETSVMLALDPDKVSMKKAGKFASDQSKFLKSNKYLAAYGSHAFGWKIQDLNPLGVVGNAKAATAEKGEALLAHSVDGLLKLFAEIDRFDMKLFERQPKI